MRKNQPPAALSSKSGAKSDPPALDHNRFFASLRMTNRPPSRSLMRHSATPFSPTPQGGLLRKIVAGRIGLPQFCYICDMIRFNREFSTRHRLIFSLTSALLLAAPWLGAGCMPLFVAFVPLMLISTRYGASWRDWWRMCGWAALTFLLWIEIIFS